MAIAQHNFIVYDLETSGLYPEDNQEIIQIAATCLRYQDFKLHDIGTFNKLIMPLHPEAAAPGAIKKIGPEMWVKCQEEGLHPKTGLKKFIEYVGSANAEQAGRTSPKLVGFNNNEFDDPFIKYWLKEHGIIKSSKDIPWSGSIDVLNQMYSLFRNDNLPNRKLDTYADLFGITRQDKIADTHEGMEDVDITAQLFVRFMTMMLKQIRPKLNIQCGDVLKTVEKIEKGS
jgi:DNA polymerase III alpha subunit (gram-positive type)